MQEFQYQEMKPHANTYTAQHYINTSINRKHQWWQEDDRWHKRIRSGHSQLIILTVQDANGKVSRRAAQQVALGQLLALQFLDYIMCIFIEKSTYFHWIFSSKLRVNCMSFSLFPSTKQWFGSFPFYLTQTSKIVIHTVQFLGGTVNLASVYITYI